MFTTSSSPSTEPLSVRLNALVEGQLVNNKVKDRAKIMLAYEFLVGVIGEREDSRGGPFIAILIWIIEGSGWQIVTTPRNQIRSCYKMSC